MKVIGPQRESMREGVGMGTAVKGYKSAEHQENLGGMEPSSLQ
jgi:hypothetical protein